MTSVQPGATMLRQEDAQAIHSRAVLPSRRSIPMLTSSRGCAWFSHRSGSYDWSRFAACTPCASLAVT
eukprot:2554271-Rhodomonas_salina.1